jgi:indolepyruvate ferredoxin oxidoreductase
MPDRAVQLNDKYTLEEGRVYLTGIQALVRLPLDQMRRDRRSGLNTGAYISGYEGSPLGGYDLALMRVKKLLDQHRVVFRPGVNEELAATAVMGTQMLDTLAADKTVDGVVGIWYGKGPGVDRCGDVFRHANMGGTGRHAGALILAGDDHPCKSSTIPHQSDFSLFNVAVPVLYPAHAQDMLDFGLAGLAMSRWSGAWVGLKCVTDACDGGATVTVAPDRPHFRFPEGYEKTVDTRIVSPFTVALEYEMNTRRLDAAARFADLNQLNQWHGAREGAWLGIASAGKAYLDTVQALRDLGVREEDLAALGIRLAKYGQTFPLAPDFTRHFAHGLQLLLVVEEKRSFLEMQLKDRLYAQSERPLIIGKRSAEGHPLLPEHYELNPETIAKVLFAILSGKGTVDGERIARVEAALAKPRDLSLVRPPNFCSGCPHNRSTILLPGQVGGGGIGCHTMALRVPDRQFSFMTQMGGEGAPWIGMQPFVSRQHVFQNIGDGTFFHSGALALEACVASGVNITFRILYNGHVAMTGGQDAMGALPIPQLTDKLKAEGVRKTVVLAEDVTRYHGLTLADNCELRPRDELARTLRELEQIPGVTAIIYDQECAAEKRRKRSRGKLVEPTTRLMINEAVCEGCGDCVKQSNCMSLNPIATEFGQKMTIHQSSCNKDYSCALGDCPSFVTVNIAPGTGLRKKAPPQLPTAEVAAPREIAPIGRDGYRILMPGVGGTGVVTVNALLATAAWIDGLSVLTLDQTGSAQKGGAVVSHLLLSREPIDAPAKTNFFNADLMLGFDAMGAANHDNLRCASERTTVVLNTNLMPSIDHIRNQVLVGPEAMIQRLESVTQRGRNLYIDANRLAEGLFGSHLASNLFLLGAAWQAGLIPLSQNALEEAIRLNGVDIEKNLQVFAWGRKYYTDAPSVETMLKPPAAPAPAEDPIERRVRELTAYQNAAYAAEFRAFLDEVSSTAPELREPVARGLFKLMAIKDEYEVARLLIRPEFETQVRETFAAVESVGYNLHPPFLRPFGITKKLRLGAWFRPFLQILASLKFLRGTPLDFFSYGAHRRLERSLIPWYRELIRALLADWDPSRLPLAQEIAHLPDQIRGYEGIKEASIEKVKKLATEKQAQWQTVREQQLT